SIGYYSKNIGVNIVAFIIADNKPSRTMHEQGKKHKENHEKFLRDIYRKEHENLKEAAKNKTPQTPDATLYIKSPTNSKVSTVNDY
ncbi:6350_t:CDS:2, partial [Scutellospora calospora]